MVADEGALWRWHRWAACGLATPGTGGPAEEVARLACVQAQEFDMTLWSLGKRTGASRDAVLQTVAVGEIVRTHAMRPTWHFIHRAHLARVQAATADRVHQVAGPYYRSAGLDAPTLQRWREWLVQHLQSGPMTRDEVKQRQSTAGFGFDGMTLGHALMWAELEMVIASGPPRGNAHTYRLLEPSGTPDRVESIAWLVERFLSSHGPSSVADVQAWSSLRVTDIRRAISDLGATVNSAEVMGDIRYWIGDLDARGWNSPDVALLNGFDEFISGLSANSKAHLDPGRLYLQRRGTPFAVLMIDGALAGHWRRTIGVNTVAIDVKLLRDLTPDEEEALVGAVQQYADFIGLPPVLVIAAVH